MMLCLWDGKWYLTSGFNPEKGGYWLTAGREMPRHELFKPVSLSGFHYCATVPADVGVTFYRELRFNGLRVTPCCWRADSPEPVLRCQLDLGDLPTDWTKDTVTDCIRGMCRDGWHRPDRSYLEAWVLVSELELIEGDAPLGQV